MYYEEKLIDGILHFRTSPHVEFIPMSLKRVSKMVVDLQQQVFKLQQQLESLISK